MTVRELIAQLLTSELDDEVRVGPDMRSARAPKVVTSLEPRHKGERGIAWIKVEAA